jgi:hypothetical protein
MSKSKKPGRNKSVSASAAVRRSKKTVASTAATVSNKTIVISANDLRILAEAADGTRKTKLYIVEGDKKRKVGVDKKPGATSIVLELQTDEKEAFDTPAILSSDPVLDRYVDEDGNEIEFKMADCDAVFTSLSAVEKFLVPYYAKMQPLDKVQKMRDNFATSTVTAAAFHLPSSYEGLAVPGGVVFAKQQGVKLKGMAFSDFVK